MVLRNNNRVLGVEPNLEMRMAGEYALKKFDNFFSIFKTSY